MTGCKPVKPPIRGTETVAPCLNPRNHLRLRLQRPSFGPRKVGNSREDLLDRAETKSLLHLDRTKLFNPVVRRVPSRVDSSRARPRQTAGLNWRPAGTGKWEHGWWSGTQGRPRLRLSALPRWVAKHVSAGRHWHFHLHRPTANQGL